MPVDKGGLQNWGAGTSLLSLLTGLYINIDQRFQSIDINRSRLEIELIKNNCHYLYLRRFHLLIEVLASNDLLRDQEEEITDRSQIYSRTEGTEPLPEYDAADAIGMALD
jgi:hypothetical protein